MKRKELLSSLREKNPESLLKELEEAYKKLSDLRFDLFEKKLKNYKKIKETKKHIARMLTILNERRRKNGQKD